MLFVLAIACLCAIVISIISEIYSKNGVEDGGIICFEYCSSSSMHILMGSHQIKYPFPEFSGL